MPLGVAGVCLRLFIHFHEKRLNDLGEIRRSDPKSFDPDSRRHKDVNINQNIFRCTLFTLFF